MRVPSELKYTASHEWVKVNDDGSLTIGITDHAQEALGDLVFVELPDVGRTLSVQENVVIVESVKAAADVYAPVSGTVSEINPAIIDAPELINQDAYSAWLFKLVPDNLAELDALLDAKAYLASCQH